MLYYDDRDYYNSENIDDLYDEDDMIFEDEGTESDWEYDYHNLTEELIDD